MAHTHTYTDRQTSTCVHMWQTVTDTERRERNKDKFYYLIYLIYSMPPWVEWNNTLIEIMIEQTWSALSRYHFGNLILWKCFPFLLCVHSFLYKGKFILDIILKDCIFPTQEMLGNNLSIKIFTYFVFLCINPLKYHLLTF